jgi:hypothetical protein
MARTSFSGPVRAGYQGGDLRSQPLTPSTINSGEVIEVNQGTGAYGFYSRVEPTVGFGSSTFQTPGEAYGMFGRVQTGAPFATAPRPISTIWLVLLVTLRSLVPTLTTA